MSDSGESLESRSSNTKFRFAKEPTKQDSAVADEPQQVETNRGADGGGNGDSKRGRTGFRDDLKGPWRGGKKLRPDKVKGKDENGNGGSHANKFKRLVDGKDDEVAIGGDEGTPPGLSGKKLRPHKVKEKDENGEVGSLADKFKRIGNGRVNGVVTGGGKKPPNGLCGKPLELLNRDKQIRLKKNIEKRKSVTDISIPQWQIEEIRKTLNLQDGQENVDFFKHFINNEDINSPFKNEYLRVINNEKSLLKASVKNEAPLNKMQAKRKRSVNDKFYKECLKKEDFGEMKSFREKLPAFGSRPKILSMIGAHQVILVKGETGSGKTTQIPQFILDQAMLQRKGSDCRIICTQPRRISAITLSERVAAERGEKLGHSVGYQIRLESRKPRKEGASITFCTTGIILSIMQNDPCLKDYSHLILDEIHERDAITDLLLAIIKMILPYRKDLKIILMSATLTAETFTSYFNNCPTVEIPGFTFPVEEFYLEDVVAALDFHPFKGERVKQNKKNKQFFKMIDPYLQDIRSRYSAQVLLTISNPQSETNQNGFIVELISHITATKPEGAILVFLPSLAQITEVHKLLSNHRQLSQMSTLIYPLHSKVPQLDQKAVFSRCKPGTRKVILSTNIAETSITIDDVVYVINAGRHKINMFEEGISSLRDEWISISNEIQRKGRAGRVQPGVCYHLYTRARRSVMLQNTPPEILRVALDEVILNIKILALGDARLFLERLLDRPSDSVIEESLKLLNRLNAIDDSETLTPLGYHLARLRMNPRTGKMVLLSSIFSCTDPISSIAASLSFKDAFNQPFGKEDEVNKVRRKFAKDFHSDHLMLANVIHQWGQLSYWKRPGFAWRNFLNLTTMDQLCSIKQQYCEYFYAAKFLQNAKPEAYSNNRNSGNEKLLRAIVGAGLYPNVAVVRSVIRNQHNAEGRANLAIEGQGPATIHPSSVNSTLANYDSNFVVYYNKLKMSKLTIFDTTVVNPFPLFFFGDNHAETAGGFELISIAGHYCLKCNKETYRLIQDLRNGFNLFLQKKICEPSPVDWSSEEGNLLRAIIQLITIDGKFENHFDYDDPAPAPDHCRNPEDIHQDEPEPHFDDYRHYPIF